MVILSLTINKRTHKYPQSIGCFERIKIFFSHLKIDMFASIKMLIYCIGMFTYRNDPMFSDTWVWAISVDPDQTAPRGAV